MRPQNVATICLYQILVVIQPISMQLAYEIRSDGVLTGETGSPIEDCSLGSYLPAAVDTDPSHQVVAIRLLRVRNPASHWVEATIVFETSIYSAEGLSL